jgi:hypothetical protein
MSTWRLVAGSIMGQCLHYYHARPILPLLLMVGPSRQLDLNRLTFHIAAFSQAAIRGMFPRQPREASAVRSKGKE